MKSMQDKRTLAVAAASVMDLSLFVCCFFIGSQTSGYALNVSILVLGSSFGWLGGTFISPYTEKEQTEFAGYVKALSVFLSGYLVAKINDIVGTVFSPAFLASPEAAFRMILSLAANTVALVFTFLMRRYADKPEQEPQNNESA